ncbi:hypothetical protein MBAV_002105 [Candidatus Magnetobacterium bavaricum]|uniref:Uncharacterized protein n=1 Tax=Candidatus Magnetobacterium bavaricum TaxID=29290 RepID=A0A0F3GUW2_9BACT|nr:hypothetical protein MBAV_002105 [Candidatus Magnetobacterium bavaricum]
MQEAQITKRYDTPKTPYKRVLEVEHIPQKKQGTTPAAICSFKSCCTKKKHYSFARKTANPCHLKETLASITWPNTDHHHT